MSKLVASYKQHNVTNVPLFNFDGDDTGGRPETDDVLTRFICDLPNAEKACKAYKNDTVVNGADLSSQSNVSLKSFAQHDRIAKVAHKRGMLGDYNLEAFNCSSAVSAIQDCVENQLGLKYTDLIPLTCVN